MRRADPLLAFLLAVAFVAAGAKTLLRAPPAGYAFQSVASKPLPPNAVAAAPVVAPPVVSAALSSPSLQSDAHFVSSRPGQAVHAATLVELNNGNLRAVWFSGSREGAGDVTIETAVLDTTAMQWGAESTLLERQQIQRDLWRYVKKIGNPVIGRAPDGSLYLWMVTVSLGGWAGSSISYMRSVDDGVSWSPMRRLVTSPFLNISTLVKGNPVALQNGQIALPVYHEFVTKFAEVLRLDASGQVLDKQRIPNSQTNLQPVLLPADAQHAQIFMRSGLAQSVMRSATVDGGKHWSPAQPIAWHNPDSALAGLTARDGTAWLALNTQQNTRQVLDLISAEKGASFDAAQPMTAETSPTPGQLLSIETYEDLLGQELLEAGASAAQTAQYVASARRQLCGVKACSLEYSYPYLLQSRDGHMHLIYTWHRSRIKHLRFDPLQPLADTHAPTAH
jgi:predicted neuraminidase